MSRNTNQKQVVLNFLVRSRSHPTAEQIYKAVKKTLPYISLGTVYRNLGVLEEQGDITSIIYSKEYTRYEARLDTHYHFICLRCDKVIEIEMDEMIDINQEVSRRHKLTVENHRLFFFGYCKDCQKIR